MLRMMGELALTSTERSMRSTVVIKDFVASYLAGPNLSSVVGALSSQQ